MSTDLSKDPEGVSSVEDRSSTSTTESSDPTAGETSEETLNPSAESTMTNDTGSVDPDSTLEEALVLEPLELVEWTARRLDAYRQAKAAKAQIVVVAVDNGESVDVASAGATEADGGFVESVELEVQSGIWGLMLERANNRVISRSRSAMTKGMN